MNVGNVVIHLRISDDLCTSAFNRDAIAAAFRWTSLGKIIENSCY